MILLIPLHHNLGVLSGVRSIPLELLLKIIHNASPYDLLQLQATCRTIKSLLDNKAYWERSRRDMDPPLPDPPTLALGGNWSETAYVSFIFGGGYCCLESCKKWTETMPASFSLRMRFCSRNCRSLMGQVVGPIAGKALLKRRKQPHFESFRLWLPILESGDEVPKYRYSMIKEYNTEFLQASNNSGSTALDDLQKTWAKRAEARSTITVNARALCEWAISYEAIKSEVLKSNVIFLKAVKPAGTTFGKMMKSPTLAKHFNAFNRDLEKITFTVWYAIRRIVVQEIRDYDTALPSTGPIQRCKQCPSSTRIFTLEALLHHSLRMHDDTSNLPTLQTGRERLCNLCLKSRKLFSAEGMTAHIKAKHPALIPYP